MKKVIGIMIVGVFLGLSCAKKETVKPTPEEEKAVGTKTTTAPSPVEEKQVAEEIVLERIHFDFDKSEIRPDAAEILKRNAKILLAHPEIRIRIEGHCDERGSNEYNLALGQRRAESAKKFLVKLGVSPDRIETVSYGEERPLDPRHNEEAWAKNRRAEFVIISR